MKREMLALIFVLSFVFVYASDSQVDINLIGCSEGDYNLFYGDCSADGEKFCDQGTMLTMVQDNCSLGDSPCCPAGFFCNGSDRCAQRTTPCTDHEDQDACEEGQCFWFSIGDNEGFCADRPSEMNCGIYPNKDSCEEDSYNLGQVGDGTDVCGNYLPNGLLVKQDSCACSWNDSSDICELTYEVTEEYENIGGSSGGSKFRCNKKFINGDCIDGVQTIITNVTFNPHKSLSYLQSVGCVNSERTRVCGRASVKLPGLSTWGILIVLLVVIMYYLLSSKQNVKKKKVVKKVVKKKKSKKKVKKK
jgi:hypothetical protein